MIPLLRTPFSQHVIPLLHSPRISIFEGKDLPLIQPRPSFLVIAPFVDLESGSSLLEAIEVPHPSSGVPSTKDCAPRVPSLKQPQHFLPGRRLLSNIRDHITLRRSWTASPLVFRCHTRSFSRVSAVYCCRPPPKTRFLCSVFTWFSLTWLQLHLFSYVARDHIMVGLNRWLLFYPFLQLCSSPPQNTTYVLSKIGRVSSPPNDLCFRPPLVSESFWCTLLHDLPLVL